MTTGYITRESEPKNAMLIISILFSALLLNATLYATTKNEDISGGVSGHLAGKDEVDEKGFRPQCREKRDCDRFDEGWRGREFDDGWRRRERGFDDGWRKGEFEDEGRRRHRHHHRHQFFHGEFDPGFYDYPYDGFRGDYGYGAGFNY